MEACARLHAEVQENLERDYEASFNEANISISSIPSDDPWEKSDFLELSLSLHGDSDNSDNIAPNRPSGSQPNRTPPPAAFVPKLDSIKTEYHPQSDRHVKTTEQHFEDYCEYDRPDKQPEALKQPWLPFRSKSDFEFAEVAQAAHLNNGDIDRLLNIFQRCSSGGDKLSLRSSKDLNELWSHASKIVPTFEHEKLHVDHDVYSGGFDIYYRSLWDWACSLLDDPFIAKDFEWDARRLFKFDGEKYERFVHEPWTANSWWDIQSKLPAGAVPLCFVIYADKTKLSSFGTKKGYPVFARIANLPKDLRNGRGYTGGRLVGWLPIVAEDQEATGKTDYVNFKRVIWHSSFLKFLESIREPSWHGHWKKCADRDQPRWIFPLVFVLSADYEEQSIMALTRGSNANKPCPVCLVSHDKLSDVHHRAELRSADQTQSVIQEARALQANGASKSAGNLLQSYGIKDIENAFWSIQFSDPHKILGFDHMHNHPHGLGGKHLWKEFQKHILSQSKGASKDVQTRAAAFPRWRGLHHFNEIMAEAFNDAMKLDDVVKIAPFLAHDMFEKSKNPASYCLLKLMRAYLIFDGYLTLEVQTESTIKSGRQQLDKYGDIMKEYIELTKQDPKSWNFVKNHLHVHAFDDIEAKGVLSLYNTVFNEPLHGPLKDAYTLRTNGKDVDIQLLRIDHEMYVTQFIRFLIDTSEEIEKARVDAESKDADVAEAQEAKCVFGNIKLGTPKKQVTVRELLASFTSGAQLDHRFDNFQSNLSSFLKNTLHHLALKPAAFTVHDQTKITPYRFIKVSYKSSATWRTSTDYLRCNDELKSPRHDCVMVQTSEGIIFAQLVFVFVIRVAKVDYALALVEMYDYQEPEGKRLQQKDADLSLLRLRKTGTVQFITAQSIIRGAVISPAYDIATDYMVFDLLDPDIFLRVRSLLQIFEDQE